MYDEIEKQFSTKIEFKNAIGIFNRAELKFAYPQCSFPCESTTKDIEFNVYGAKGCVKASVVTQESFLRYKVKSVEMVSGVCR